MAIIKSGASTDLLTVDPTSKAARVTTYDTAGNVITLASSANQTNGTQRTGALIGTSAQLAFSTPIVARNAVWAALQVVTEPSGLFYDAFDAASIDLTDRWAANPAGSVAPTATAGSLLINPGTAANAFTVLNSKPNFQLQSGQYLRVASIFEFEPTTLITGTTRAFGLGTCPVTPTPTAPFTNFVGFVLRDTTLTAEVWSAGVQVYVSAITSVTLTDGFQHRYTVHYRGSQVYWQLDNGDTWVANVSSTSSGYEPPANQALPVLFFQVNGASILSGATLFEASVIGVSDPNHNSNAISDGQFMWIKQSVKWGTNTVNYPIPTDNLAVVGLSPNNNRTSLCFYATGVASGATGVETAITLTKASGTAATSAAASFVVTNLKKFRIQAVVFAMRGNATATAADATFRIRVNTGGAVTTTSTPIILQARCAVPATASAWDRVIVPVSEKHEPIMGNGTIQFGVTANSVFVTNAPTWDVLIIGYEE